MRNVFENISTELNTRQKMNETERIYVIQSRGSRESGPRRCSVWDAYHKNGMKEGDLLNVALCDNYVRNGKL